MSDQLEILQILSDREVLTRTLLEVETLLEHPRPETYLLSSFRARARLLWLLRCLCHEYLTSQQLASIDNRSRTLREILSRNPSNDHDLTLGQLLALSLVQKRDLR